MKNGVDPVMLLTVLTVFFACLLVLVDWLFNGEGQVFQVIASGFTGSLGALLLAIKQKVQPGEGATTATAIVNQPPAGAGNA